jgi:DNA-binding response OmpR family regulator
MGARILVVDDELDVIELVGLAMERYGYTIIAAQSGEEALAKAQTERPDLVILDVKMPDINGHEVCRRLRAIPELADIGIILFTARNTTQDKIRGLNAGADDHVSKPVHPGELRARVQAVLLRRKPREEPKGPAARMAGVIGVKGGVGTSSLVVQMGAVLQQSGSVIVADLGTGGSTLALQLGSRGDRGIADLLSQPAEALTKAMVEAELYEHSSGLRVLAGQMTPVGRGAAMNEEQAMGLVAHLRALGNWLVVDLGRSLGDVQRAILGLCDQVVVVTEPGPIAEALAKRLTDELIALEIQPHFTSVVVVNRGTAAAQGGSAQELEAALGISVAGIVPPAADLLKEAERRGVPLIEAYPTSAVTQQIRSITAYVERS